MPVAKLHHKKIEGGQETLVILHGFLGSLDNWNSLAKQFSNDFTVYLIDARNHGRSEHLDQHDYDAMSKDLDHFLEEQMLDRIHLIGHSMGGKTAIRFASQHVDKLKSLIVVDISLRRNPPSHNHILAAINRLDIDNLSSRREAQEALAEGIREEAIIQFLMKNLGRENNGFKWKSHMVALTNNYDNILDSVYPNERIDVSTLFITGERSQYVTTKDEEDIKNYFNNVNIVEIPEAGHWVHAEKPRLFIESCMAFYRSKGIL